MALSSPSAKRVHRERTADSAPHVQNPGLKIVGPPRAGEQTAIQRTQALIEGLLRVAEDADRLSGEAARIEHIPLVIRASVIDRVAQLSYFIRLLARQVDVHGEKTMNIPVDG